MSTSPTGRQRRVQMGCALHRSTWVLGPLLLVPVALRAEDHVPAKPAELPPITIVGLSEPTAPSLPQAQDAITGVPGGATIIDTTRYREGATGSLSTFLGMVPGVFSEPQAGGQETRLSIRGSGIQADDILGVTFLQDGIPINEGDGEADIEELDLGNMRYAEVYRGSDALRYGGLGLGGAINFVSLTGRDVGPLNGRFEGGSFGYHQEHVSSGFASGPWDGVVAIGDQGFDGYRDHSAESTQRVVGNVGYQINPDWLNRVYVSYIKLTRDVPDDLTKEQLQTDPRQTDQDSIDQDFYRHWYEVRVSDKLSYVSGLRSVDVVASGNYRWWRENDLYENDNPQGIWEYQSKGLAGNVTFVDRTPYLGAESQLILGLLPNWELEPDHYYENINGQTGATIAQNRTVATNVVLFAEERHAIARQWSVVLGAQVVHARRVYQDTFDGSATFGEEDEQSFTGFNPKIGVIYKPADKVQLYANVSRSYQAPSFDDLVQLGDGTGPLYTYTPLEAQSAWTAEIGTRSEMAGAEWDVSLYRSWVRNELLEVNDQFGNDIGTVNATPTYHQGIEIGLTMDLLGHGDQKAHAHHLMLQQSYTLSDFHFSDDPVYGHNRIAGIPINFYRASLIYQHPSGFYVGPKIEWNMSAYPVDQANTLDADSYLLIGARAGFLWNEQIRIFIEGSNLTNKTYAAVVAPIPDARMQPDPAIFRPGNGRSVVGGLEATW